MVNFWVSLAFLLVSWIFSVAVEGLSNQILFMSGLFFALYFVTPLLKKRSSQIIYLILPLLLGGMFFSENLNVFVWLMYLALALQSTQFFKETSFYFYLFYLYVLMSLPYFMNQQWMYVSYLSLLALITGTLLYFLHQAIHTRQTLEQQYETLTNEFRTLKRQIISGEKAIRQEERNQIAREIHDSVGHQLTALLMQIEAARIQAPDEGLKDKFSHLKQLAKQSLNETREAVKTLRSEETGGIQAIIQLIRKMEAESQLRLTITMQSGVLGVVLSNQQSVTIYRAIQEALTNMMRHSQSRQATIEFRRVADRDFRFEISHPLKEKVRIIEGFGLTNMRERLAEIDGRMSIVQDNEILTIIGQFPLEGKQHD